MTRPFDPAVFGVDLELRYMRWGWMVLPKNDTWVGGAVRMYGEYSQMECTVLQAMLHPGDTVVEGGTQVGGVTLPMLAAIGDEGRLIGFEPQPVFQMLGALNVALNGYSDVCQMRNQGLGREMGTMHMPILTYNAVGNYGGLDLKEWNEKRPGEGNVVQIVTIDSLGLEKCDFIKLDIEGMEKDALEGGRETIERFHPTMSLECDREDTGPPLIEYVRELGYTPYWMITPLYSEGNFYKKPLDDTAEIFCSFNILCIHGAREARNTVRGFHEAHSTDAMKRAPGEWVITALKGE